LPLDSTGDKVTRVGVKVSLASLFRARLCQPVREYIIHQARPTRPIDQTAK